MPPRLKLMHVDVNTSQRDSLIAPIFDRSVGFKICCGDLDGRRATTRVVLRDFPIDER